MAEERDPDRITDRVDQVDLQVEMQRSYLDYAMSVIVGRALPDVRDGLKPVHRRVLYAMYDGGYRPDKSFSKCSRVVGDVMGKFHPHGDSAIYDALVRLVQPWSMRYPLAAGQGNFGSPGNDGAAAPRYTETKMANLALEMVRDLHQNLSHERVQVARHRPTRALSHPLPCGPRHAPHAAAPPTGPLARPTSHGMWRTRRSRQASAAVVP